MNRHGESSEINTAGAFTLTVNNTKCLGCVLRIWHESRIRNSTPTIVTPAWKLLFQTLTTKGSYALGRMSHLMRKSRFIIGQQNARHKMTVQKFLGIRAQTNFKIIQWRHEDCRGSKGCLGAVFRSTQTCFVPLWYVLYLKIVWQKNV
jgi:hypothetical protein